MHDQQYTEKSTSYQMDTSMHFMIFKRIHIYYQGFFQELNLATIFA